MRRRQLECIRAFVREVDARTRSSGSGRSRRVQEARLVRAFHHLPADVKRLVAAGYRQCLMAMASGDTESARAGRQAIVANLVRSTGLTREQILGIPAVPDESAWPAEAEIVGRLRRRPDSEPGSQSTDGLVAAAVPSLPRAQRPRTTRWLPYALAAFTAMACVGLFLAWSWYQTPMQRLTAPEPTAREVFPIFQMINLDDGLLLFSHGETDGETTWLNAFEVYFGETPRPAADLRVEADARDSDGDIENALPVPEVSEPGERIPPRSMRRRVIPVKRRRGDDAVLIKVTAPRDKSDKSTLRPADTGPLHRLLLDR